MLFTSGLLCCNGTPLAGGDGVGRRCLDFAGGSRADVRLLGSGRRLILDVDRFEAGLGDAKRHGSSFVIATPDRAGATSADLLQPPGPDERSDALSGGFALKVCRQFNSAVLAA